LYTAIVYASSKKGPKMANLSQTSNPKKQRKPLNINR
jgi:hypothetical protein